MIKKLLELLKKSETASVPEGYYGGDRTWHSGGEVNVELDRYGNVCAVWFRCRALPFTQSAASVDRVADMKRMYAEHKPEGIEAIIFEKERL
jgi:hypothetical protein